MDNSYSTFDMVIIIGQIIISCVGAVTGAIIAVGVSFVLVLNIHQYHDPEFFIVLAIGIILGFLVSILSIVLGLRGIKPKK